MSPIRATLADRKSSYSSLNSSKKTEKIDWAEVRKLHKRQKNGLKT